MSNTKFEFSVLPKLEIDTATAAQILGDPDPELAFVAWVSSAKPEMQFANTFCEIAWLRESLGKALTEQSIQEAKQLTIPA